MRRWQLARQCLSFETASTQILCDDCGWYGPLPGLPTVYSLRAGESFTRYLEPGLEDGKTYLFWAKDYFNIGGKPMHGPFCNVTFLDQYPVGNGKKPVTHIHQANGVFEYNPPLADGKYKEGVRTERNATFADGVLRGKAAEAIVVFEHASPYVIAAWPEKRGDREWNLFEETCVDGAVASGTAVGKVPVKVLDRCRTDLDGLRCRRRRVQGRFH